MSDLSQAQQDKLDAAAFRRLLSHLDNRKDVQNIDLMILADFCRNCLGDVERRRSGAGLRHALLGVESEPSNGSHARADDSFQRSQALLGLDREIEAHRRVFSTVRICY